MQNTTVNNAIENFKNLIEQALNENETINIATDNGNIIMISEHLYNSLLLTAEAAENPEFKASLLQGLHAPLSDFVNASEVKW